MGRGNLKLAYAAVKTARWRSMLTIFGVVVGIVSVVTTLGLGEGVKRQVSGQINHRGEDLVTVLPGRRVTRAADGHITGYNPFDQESIVLTEKDYQLVAGLPEVGDVAPFSRLSGLVTSGDKSFDGTVIATSDDLPGLLKQKVAFGSFFNDNEEDKNFAVIGTRVAEQLFGENVPIGKALTIRGHTFRVQGVFDEFPENPPLLQGTDYNRAVFIDHQIGKQLVDGAPTFYQILARPSKGVRPEKLSKRLQSALLDTHAGQQDFTVLEANELMVLTGSFLSLLTKFTAAVASVSLLVGGVGVMNIMLVSVTERTSEIGIRKSVGATNQQILKQFIVEALVLSGLGGLLGIFCSVVANIAIRIFTDLEPVITLQILLGASLVTFLIGVVFGVVPAVKAARKDPIEALRYNQ